MTENNKINLELNINNEKNKNYNSLYNFISSQFTRENGGKFIFKIHVNIIIWYIFSIIYFNLSNFKSIKMDNIGDLKQVTKFNKKLNLTESYYFSSMIHSTIGSSRIYPVGIISKFFVWIHLIITTMILITPDVRKINRYLFYIHILGIIIFSIIYYMSSRNGATYKNIKNKNIKLNIINAIDMAITNQTTLGTSKIYSSNKLAKIISITQVAYTFLILSSFSYK